MRHLLDHLQVEVTVCHHFQHIFAANLFLILSFWREKGRRSVRDEWSLDTAHPLLTIAQLFTPSSLNSLGERLPLRLPSQSFNGGHSTASALHCSTSLPHRLLDSPAHVLKQIGPFQSSTPPSYARYIIRLEQSIQLCRPARELSSFLPRWTRHSLSKNQRRSGSPLSTTPSTDSAPLSLNLLRKLGSQSALLAATLQRLA